MADADRLIEVFNQAKAPSAGAERDGFLGEACGDEAELKEQGLSLLQAHERAGGFLQSQPALSPEVEVAVSIEGVPYGIWLGMASSLLVTSLCTIETLAAGMLARRHGRVSAAIRPYIPHES